ncbi:ABC transporter ATP-binding protein [Candidatus Woesearchaeota archaeon]|nr:ABC transporter ATP-binding protein [Candidatus Woesearchaeota archaeon]
MRKADDDLLRIGNLAIILGGKTILENININVRDGEMLGLVGVSGAGKTSLLNSIIGYYPVARGDILYNSPRKKRLISILDKFSNFRGLFGFSAQNPSFYPELSVMENLEYFASLYNIPDDIKVQNIERALKLVKLHEHKNAIAKNLSGGMKKRLDIACAIVHFPKVLLLDEPTSDMDPLLRIQIWGLVEDINKSGTTIIVASHFLSEIEHICDRIVLIHNKRVEFEGSPKHFRNIHAKTKEIHIATRDGKYSVILKKIMDMPFLEVKRVLKKKGRIIIHSKESDNVINNAISKLLRGETNISDVEVTNPSMDMLFKLFVEK